MEERTHHSSAQALHLNRDTRQYHCASGDKDERNSRNAEEGRWEHVHPAVTVSSLPVPLGYLGYSQTSLRTGGYCARDRRHHGEDHPREKTVLPVHVLERLSSSQGYHEPDGPHGQESKSRVARGQLIDLLRHQDDVVNDVLVASVTG